MHTSVYSVLEGLKRKFILTILEFLRNHDVCFHAGFIEKRFIIRIFDKKTVKMQGFIENRGGISNT